MVKGDQAAQPGGLLPTSALAPGRPRPVTRNSRGRTGQRAARGGCRKRGRTEPARTHPSPEPAHLPPARPHPLGRSGYRQRGAALSALRRPAQAIARTARGADHQADLPAGHRAQPGGLGKSALARQYAIAYADFYATGGVWELKCAGLGHLGDALRQLEQQEELREHNFNLEEVREESPDEQARSALAQLKRITQSGRDTVNEQLRNLEDRHTPEDQLEAYESSRCLLILDNVDETELLAADQLGLIPAEDWLSVIITTRLSPDSFGAATSLRSIQVPPLSLIEGVELLRTFMPGESFPDADETQAAEDLVKVLDGYTYALELIGAFVNTNWTAGARLEKYLRTLEAKGLAATDTLARKKGVQDKIAYQNKQIALIVEDLLTSLRQQLAEEYGEEMATAAHQIAEIASLLQPDAIPAPWLQAILKQAHPDLEETDEGLEPWGIILQAMMQLSLLSPAERKAGADEADANVLRMHRVTAAHIANQSPESGEWHWRQICAVFTKKSFLARPEGLIFRDYLPKVIKKAPKEAQAHLSQIPRIYLELARDLQLKHRIGLKQG